MNTIKTYLFLLLAAVLLTAPACNTSKAVKGGAAGGAAGGVIGGAIGKKSGNGTKGAIIGSVIGGAAGAVIGDYMDRQAKEIEEEIPGATVDRVQTVDSTGNTVTESVTITFESGVLFPLNKYELTTNARQELDRMADIFYRYPDTDLLIEGHTDSQGTEQYNQELSEKRAASVSDYLASHRISRQRMTTRGYGETRPVASNETEAGRQENRRVEVSIQPNENLRRKAEAGEPVGPQ